jgi:Holliday junction resolvase RusA-like endonuclease
MSTLFARYQILDLEMVRGAVSVDYQFVKPDQRKRDLANLEKAISDLLVSMSLIDDDSQIIDMRLRWSTDIETPVQIILSEIKEADAK